MYAPARVAETARVYHLHPPLLPLGHLVASPGALEVVREHGVDVVALLRRHAAGDWGRVSPEDAHGGDLAVRHGARVLSAYPTPGGTLWVLTEADRSATTVLLPSEY